jgi:hypothetical protein
MMQVKIFVQMFVMAALNLCRHGRCVAGSCGGYIAMIERTQRDRQRSNRRELCRFCVAGQPFFIPGFFSDDIPPSNRMSLNEFSRTDASEVCQIPLIGISFHGALAIF